MNHPYELFELVNSQVEELLEQGQRVRPQQLGLDGVIGFGLVVADEWIAVQNQAKGRLEYYGGFEYVDDRYKMILGDWTFYLNEDDRVEEHIQFYRETQE